MQQGFLRRQLLVDADNEHQQAGYTHGRSPGTVYGKHGEQEAEQGYFNGQQPYRVIGKTNEKCHQENKQVGGHKRVTFVSYRPRIVGNAHVQRAQGDGDTRFGQTKEIEDNRRKYHAHCNFETVVEILAQ